MHNQVNSANKVVAFLSIFSEFPGLMLLYANVECFVWLHVFVAQREKGLTLCHPCTFCFDQSVVEVGMYM